MIHDAQSAANARTTFMIKFFHSVVFHAVNITHQIRIHTNPASMRRDIANLMSPPMKSGNASDWLSDGIQFQIKGTFVFSLIPSQERHFDQI